MSEHLVRTLLRLSVQPDGTELTDGVTALERADPKEWAAARETLAHHRVEALAWHGIQSRGLMKTVPDEPRKRLQQAYQNTLFRNGALFHALGEALDALDRAGICPVLWKGVVLAGCFYPALAMRSMDDIDLTIEAGEAEAAGAAFKSIGFDVAMRQEEAVYYRNPAGIVFDVHHRVRLFEGQDRAAITTTAHCPYLPGRELRILAPEALLAHLTVHAQGHRASMGYLLRWIVDLHFVVNQVSDQVVVERLRKLIPSRETFILFLRFLGFLDHELGAAPPEPFRKLVASVRPLSLAETLRSRRLTMWGLPGPRGLARLILGRSTSSAGERRPWPRPGDLFLWPLDRFREIRTNSQLT